MFMKNSKSKSSSKQSEACSSKVLPVGSQEGLHPELSQVLAHTPSKQSDVLRQGTARRVIFYYPGEEGTYVENAEITLFHNGIVFLKSAQEETTTHIQNCEIMWNYEVMSEDRHSKIRVLSFAKD
jgi:hypothetical protein